ncbi:MAG: APC family permease [Gemmatimonadetes bacterium]|nr:APC family permease [Gemmatimonadota bacterium]
MTGGAGPAAASALAPAPARPRLARALSLRDLVLLNVVAVFTPSTIAQSLPLGRAGVLAWALAGAAFLFPYAAAVAALSRRHPVQGGVYAWTRMAFGHAHGFACGWCYWVNTFLYLPTLFLGVAAVASLLGGARTAWLATSGWATVALALGALWGSTALHVAGLGQGKWIQNAGAAGRLLIALGLLGAAWWTLAHPAAAPATGAAAAASFPGALGVLALWPFILNALVGLDLGAAMSEEATAPADDLPRALRWGGGGVMAAYLLAFGAALVTGLSDGNVITGHVQAITGTVARAGTGAAFAALGALFVLAEVAGLLGTGAAWLAAPARIPFAIGLDRHLPAAFARVHPRFGTPWVALLVQAGVATGLILLGRLGATLQEAYLVLLGGSIVLVLVPYGYLLLAWRRLAAREAGGAVPRRVALISGLGLAAVAVALAGCFVPPPAVAGVLLYEGKLVAAVAGMLGVGWMAWRRGSGSVAA